MKTLTLTLAFALCVGFSAMAQNQPKSKASIDARVTEETRAMAQKIGVNEREYITLRKLNQERISQTVEAESMYSNDAEMRDLKLKEINDQFDTQLVAVLNPKQQEAYAEYKQVSGTPVNIAGAKEEEQSAEEKAAEKK